MKRYIITTLMLAASLFCGCSGNVDPDDTGNQTAEPTEPFVLEADKTVIEADGEDAAVFRIIDANGLDLTGSEYVRNTSFHIEETDEYVSGMTEKTPNIFRCINDGTYTITAMYSGKQCGNSVSVKVQNRSKYETFHKNVALYRLTRTNCPYCPYMSEALEKINDYTKDHIKVLEFHNSDEYALPYGTTDLADMLLKLFASSDEGYPYCIYSLYEGSGKRTVTDMQSFVKKQLYDNPAKTGIKAESSADDSSIRIDATVKASAAGKYDLGFAILEDNCIPSTSNASEDVYNGVVRSISGNFYAMSTDSFDLGANEEKQISKTIDASISESDRSDFRIVLFTLREADGKVIIDNVADFQLGKSVDYAYN